MTEVGVPFAEEGGISIDRFWELADDLLYTKTSCDNNTHLYFTEQCKDGIANRLGLCSEDEINTLLVNFIALVVKYCDELSVKIGDEKFYSLTAEYLMKFEYYQTHLKFCVRKMLSLLVYAVDSNLNNLKLNVDELGKEMSEVVNESIETNEKFIKIIGWILYEHYNYYNKELLEILKDFSGFTILFKVLENYIEISKTIKDGIDVFGSNYANYMKLYFELCKSYEFKQEISKIKQDNIIYLIKQLKVEARMENEINYLIFRLLLVLNEQYMYECGMNIYIGDSKNLIVDSILKDDSNKYFQTFNEILILNFNREMNVIDQILMMKYLYVIFSNEISNRLMYMNDIKIIVDIIIRQLYDLQLKNNEYLVGIYLRVLHVLITETDLLFEPYKRDEISDLLYYLISSDENENGSMKSLSKRCLKATFFQNTMERSRENSLPNIKKLKIFDDPTKAASLPDLQKVGKTVLHKLHLDSERCPKVRGRLHPAHKKLPPPPPPIPAPRRVRESSSDSESILSVSSPNSYNSYTSQSQRLPLPPPPPPPPPPRTRHP